LLVEDEANLPLVVDTGASISVTFCKDDFVSDIKKLSTKNISSLSSDVAVLEVGTVIWYIRDDNGERHIIETQAYYVSTSCVRLFSPQKYFIEEFKCNGNSGHLVVDHLGVVFYFLNGGKLSFGYKDTSLLPVTYAYTTGKPWNSTSAWYGELVGSESENLTAAQKKLLSWHARLGHYDI